jgi:hypothetical protein
MLFKFWSKLSKFSNELCKNLYLPTNKHHWWGYSQFNLNKKRTCSVLMTTFRSDGNNLWVSPHFRCFNFLSSKKFSTQRPLLRQDRALFSLKFCSQTTLKLLNPLFHIFFTSRESTIISTSKTTHAMRRLLISPSRNTPQRKDIFALAKGGASFYI